MCFGTLNVTLDQVDPPFVVPSTTDEPPKRVFPTCWAAASLPAAQHWLAVGQDKSDNIGAGTLAGKESGVHESPPFVVEAMSLIQVVCAPDP
jgi:hypothetical protein